jgi:hypothetical protein
VSQHHILWVTAAIHLVAVFVAAASMVSGGPTPDALYQAVWFPLAIIDFPVSLLILAIWKLPMTDAIHESLQALSFPWRDFVNFWVPLGVFGLFGTLWWFFLSTLFIRFISRIRNNKGGRRD